MNTSLASSTASVPDGIVLFAHGSRDPLWKKPIEAVAQEIARQHPHLPVSCAYLELTEPSLPDAVAQMISVLHQNAPKSIALGAINTGDKPQNDLKKVFSIRILPMFLGMGKHAREDLPELAVALRNAHPEVDFEVAPAVGEDARVTALLAQLALT
jgi:sirohydrochlorin cobaltochelatase